MAVEFVGMLPAIAVTCVLLWQAALLGYTYVLAGNAADEAARQGAVGEGGAGRCQAAALEDLDTWRQGADVACGSAGGGMYQATVTLRVPVLFPGFAPFPFEASSRAAAVEER
ncbi:pilus assembly protein [Streptomyces sp. NPDC005805]|uniref:pilus assembly protein n=1 Tax=Streptomyces sp. NPDC005805 TaxID=3157068 RepID=UPI0034013B00